MEFILRIHYIIYYIMNINQNGFHRVVFYMIVYSYKDTKMFIQSLNIELKDSTE